MSISKKRIYISLSISLPIIVFYIVVNYLVVNVPFQDDFDGLLAPTIALNKPNLTFSEFWNTLYQQDDERRIIMNRIVAYGISKIYGHLDLTKQIFAGISTLILFVAMLLGWFRRSNIDIKYFVCIPFFLFNLHFVDATFWANIPVQQIGVFAWAFIALFFLTTEKDSQRWFSIIFGILALYSDVSGAFLFPVGALILLLQCKWKFLAGWLILLGLVIFLYFYKLEVPAYRPSLTSNLSNPVQLLIMYITMHGLWLDPGSGFVFSIRQTVTFVTGLMMFGWFLRMLFFSIWKTLKGEKQFRRDEAFVLGSLAFLTSVFFIFVLGRASEGFKAIYISRYHLIYILWAVFFYLLVLITYKNKLERISFFNPLLVSASVIYCIAAYFHFWVEADYFRKLLLTDAYEWKYNRALPSSPIYLSAKKAVDDIYEEAYITGVYRGENYPFANLFQSPVLGNTIVEIKEGEHFIDIRFPEIGRGYGKDDGVYVLLESGNERHVFATRNNTRSFLETVKNQSYYYPGATSTPILKAYLKSKSYTISAGVIDGEKHYQYKVANKLTLKN